MDGLADDRLGHRQSSEAELRDLILRWQEQLVIWARNGQLTHAARVALNLPDPHPALEAWMARIAGADLQELPPIQPLTWEEMEGCACAYAPERQLILINQEWLENAVAEQVFAVLTEQLGHHLDGLFNPVDTAGDEGERFLDVLRCGEGGAAGLDPFAEEEPHGVVHLHGDTIAVEEAGVGAICLDLRDLIHPSDPPPA